MARPARRAGASATAAYIELSETDSWSESTSSLLIRIKGTISTDATLSGLTLEGADGGEAITLSLPFATGKYTYTAVGGQPHRRGEAHGDEERRQCHGGHHERRRPDGSPGEALLDLIVGSNTLTVTVTAQDGTTTRTYTVTVERHTADTLISNTHLSPVVFARSTAILAQSFATGANAGGYTVSQVDIALGAVSGTSTSVKIRENNADNQPGDLVATLTNPASVDGRQPQHVHGADRDNAGCEHDLLANRERGHLIQQGSIYFGI